MRQKTVKKTSGAAFALSAALCAGLALFAGCGSAPAGKQAPALRAPAAVRQTEAGDFTGKKLLLVGYLHDGSFIPLEPGHGSSANIVFAADGTLSGYSGFRDFSGTWKTGKAGANGTRGCAIVIAPPKSGTPANKHVAIPSIAESDTNAAIDGIGARFEKDLFNNFAAAKKLQKEKDFIRLLGSRDEVLLQFMFAESLTQD